MSATSARPPSATSMATATSTWSSANTDGAIQILQEHRVGDRPGLRRADRRRQPLRRHRCRLPQLRPPSPMSTATAISTWSSASSDGAIAYFKNTGSATAPAFAQQTGAANPFDGIDVPLYSHAGLRRPRRRRRPRPHRRRAGRRPQLLPEHRVGDRAGLRASMTGATNPFDGIDVGGSSDAQPSAISTATATSTWSSASSTASSTISRTPARRPLPPLSSEPGQRIPSTAETQDLTARRLLSTSTAMATSTSASARVDGILNYFENTARLEARRQRHRRERRAGCGERRRDHRRGHGPQRRGAGGHG